MRPSPARLSLYVCLAWPVAVGLGLVSAIHFLRYRLGFEVHWVWEAGPILTASALVLLPLLAFGAARRIRA